ncbi:ferredoxin [Sagittula sp. S175]|uniref:ferredoxin n=1 Tax=Sagittula sp. S175 TaxID=3415129 RepID=UPI003C7C0540
MTLAALQAAAQAHGLTIRGGLHPDADPTLPQGARTLVMIGPDEPRFWPIFTAAPEYSDGLPDPMDRWSKRILPALAAPYHGTALFPSDGPPYPPFIQWAQASGHSWPSPVGLLVHDDAGLFVSYRGVIALPDHYDLTAGQRPCDTCAAPCLTACPVDAFASGSYDVPRCQAHVHVSAACQSGCLVRRACPVARGFERLPDQSAFHMSAFMRNYRP